MKTTIWSWPTRIFHWFLAFGFILAYFSGDFEYLRNIHYAFGAFISTLLLFRLIYGFIGPKHSNFSDFPLGLKYQKEFMASILSKSTAFAGHNPLAAAVMLLMLCAGLITGISGCLHYMSQNPLSMMSPLEKTLGIIHKTGATAFLILVGIHLTGILGDTLLFRKTGTLASIFTGYKNLPAQNSELSSFQKTFALLWIIIPLLAFYLAVNLPSDAGDLGKKPVKREVHEPMDH